MLHLSMCGIFFSAGIRTRASCFGPLEKCCLCGINAARAELFRGDILTLVEESIKDQTRVKPSDQLKINNAENLRAAICDLNLLRNGKANALGREQQAQDLETRIEELKLGDKSQSHQPEQSTDENNLSCSVHEDAIINILARGPDYASYTEVTLGDVPIQLVSSVLSLRQPFTAQPIANNSFILQFNGEIYNQETVSINDTNYVMSCLEENLKSCSVEDAVVKTFSALDGEFAFVLLDMQSNQVFFGKDRVGKRSLLCSLTASSLQLGSVLNIPSAEECKGNTVSVVDLGSFEKRDIEVPKQVSPFSQSSESHMELREKLRQACEIRQTTISPFHASKAKSGSDLAVSNELPASVAVLFSGGLDCSVIAALLAENYVAAGEKRVIDLLSVGFDHPRTGVPASESPDRKLSEKSWLELSQLFKDSCVSFRLVQVDVSYSEWLAHKQRVFSLISPCETEMDLSIAIAFYFAARSSSCLCVEIQKSAFSSSTDLYQTLKFEKAHFTEDNSSHLESFAFTRGYTSTPRVLFSGLGADELYGGYSRHENIFNHLPDETSEEADALTSAAYDSLATSLAHDIDIIYERNLGRDDRAMSSWGKEMRYPYLDETVVDYSLNTLSAECKIRFWWEERTFKKGTKRVKKFERKHILRLVAKSLGLTDTAMEEKRAIQFGARSAKLEVGQSKVKGTDRAI